MYNSGIFLLFLLFPYLFHDFDAVSDLNVRKIISLMISAITSSFIVYLVSPSNTQNALLFSVMVTLKIFSYSNTKKLTPAKVALLSECQAVRIFLYIPSQVPHIVALASATCPCSRYTAAFLGAARMQR